MRKTDTSGTQALLSVLPLPLKDAKEQEGYAVGSGKQSLVTNSSKCRPT